MLATKTGGFAAVNRNDFAGAFDRIVRENSSYYVLGYYPTNERRDGRFRTLAVRVKRPGLQVRSAARIRRSRAAARRRNGPPPAVDLRGHRRRGERRPRQSDARERHSTDVFAAAAYKGPRPTRWWRWRSSSMQTSFNFTDKAASSPTGSRSSSTATDRRREGALQAIDTAITMTMKPDTLRSRTGSGLPGRCHRLELPPGRYQLRVAAGRRRREGRERALRPRGPRLHRRAPR